jgi:hypothetical protein
MPLMIDYDINPFIFVGDGSTNIDPIPAHTNMIWSSEAQDFVILLSKNAAIEGQYLINPQYELGFKQLEGNFKFVEVNNGLAYQRIPFDNPMIPNPWMDFTATADPGPDTTLGTADDGPTVWAPTDPTKPPASNLYT